MKKSTLSMVVVMATASTLLFTGCVSSNNSTDKSTTNSTDNSSGTDAVVGGSNVNTAVTTSDSTSMVYPPEYIAVDLPEYPDAEITDSTFQAAATLIVPSDLTFTGTKPASADRTTLTLSSAQSVETVYAYYETELSNLNCELRSSNSLPYSGSHDCYGDGFHTSVIVGPATGGGSSIVIVYNTYN